MSSGLELLTPSEMAAADQAAVARGIASWSLMQRAGEAVAEAAQEMVALGGRISVLCGPGNNGGDGLVAAELLRRRGYRVRVGCLVPAEALKGDAALALRRWGPVEPSGIDLIAGAEVVIDALFGAGLSRPLDGRAAELADACNRSLVPVLAVDVPSGLDGSTGATVGALAFRAERTVTFHRRKPGHLLLPGRDLCGSVTVADIGIPDDVSAALAISTFANAPTLWRSSLAAGSRNSSSHKYSHGHAIVVSGGPESASAARLGAVAALRSGAGLVTLATPRAAFPVNAAHLTSVMLASFDVPEGLASILADQRRNAVLIGPGGGVGAPMRRMIEIALGSEAAIVLDADALTSLAAVGPPRLGPRVVLTPHEGEFRRLFPALGGSKLQRARDAARASGAIVVLKGADTVIAAPDGRAAINENAPPTLATAGSGDVLAGIVTGLLASGLPAFEAAAAAVWLHGRCGSLAGGGVLAEELAGYLGKAVRELSAI